MVRHGIVSTVQPLAAMAGAQILLQGGNAIDAAVATAAALNVTCPANVGIGGDLFAIIYIAKEHRSISSTPTIRYLAFKGPAPGSGWPVPLRCCFFSAHVHPHPGPR